MYADPTNLVLEEVADPLQISSTIAQRERYDQNLSWLQAHAAEVYAQHRGKCICVAGGQLFVADTPGEALAQGQAAHPHDNGRFVHYIPLEKVPRIYAN